MGEPIRKKLVVPVVFTVTILGAAAVGLGSCGDDEPAVCVVVDDAGAETPCDAGPPDGPII